MAALWDTSALIALFNSDDPLHGQTASLELSSASINVLVLAEVANVMQKRVKERKQVLQTLHYLKENTTQVPISTADLNDAVRVFERHYPRLSLADAVLVAQSKSLGEELVTFDEDLVKAAKH